MMVQKVAYGLLFVAVVPCLLAVWAVSAEENVGLQVYGTPLAGWALASIGLLLMAVGMRELWRVGGGLPMNAFPPPRMVAGGIFGLLPHPIYTGFTTACLGISMAARSAAGLWLVTPSAILGCAAIVLGYERHDLQTRFGRTLRILPADEESPPTTIERAKFLVLVLGAWVALYEFTAYLPAQGIAFAFPFESGMKAYAWTAPLYQSVYLTVVMAPWWAQTRGDLRKMMISGWVATVLVFPIYWVLPSAAPRPAIEGEGWAATLLSLERSAYPPVAAFPSFHVLWAIFIARLIRPRWLGAAYAAGVAVSCVTTGMHYIADVIAAAAIAPLLLEPSRIWGPMRAVTERLANSWSEWRLGPIRVINHGLYAGTAGFVQVAVVLAAVGPADEWKVMTTAMAGLIGAAAWAQWVEGSSRLRRPFGFYGGLIGVALACLCFEERWLLLSAHCLGAPWMQAIGRLRCFVNGCCHGGPAPEGVGIRVTHAQSRVTRLTDFGGVPIHATQLYSILGNVALGLVLVRLWVGGAPLSMIGGVYAIGNGVSRFVEEAYRGEPQTPVFFGLRLYQWISVAMAITGATLTCLGAPDAPRLALTAQGAAWAVAFGCISGAAMGVDWPESNRMLARLT
jgi:protein-S-isoprenylcysteine O-methyltransferase Ste14